MFSGIVEEMGSVIAVSGSGDGKRFRIGAAIVTSDLQTGDSVSVSGTCLTSVAQSEKWFEVEAGLETLRRTKLGALKQGDSVNLERAVRLSDRMGGHLVSGHIDQVGTVVGLEKEGFTSILSFAVDAGLSPFFVEKGSVAIDGVSLTVMSLHTADKLAFKVMLIPHTLAVTTLGQLKVGDPVNIEVDLIAKYVANWTQPFVASRGNKGAINMAFMSEHGYT